MAQKGLISLSSVGNQYQSVVVNKKTSGAHNLFPPMSDSVLRTMGTLDWSIWLVSTHDQFLQVLLCALYDINRPPYTPRPFKNMPRRGGL
ncbi:unnamed protein product [Pieris macdunnoughi]|uniref:Uncharacterized protein n=1 Tax=Pieris macdunnoughi TaxID=345717 RepID=A0A821U231_9NEOP|nr:unnamed protein product [Pieris macdunnoughi]